jgi:hypothetical protein
MHFILLLNLVVFSRYLNSLGETLMASDRHDTQNATEPPFTALLRMIRGFQVTQMIYVAAKLGIADSLTDGAKSSNDLAAATGTHAPSLYRLLRALASLGIFAEDEQGRFELTPLAQPLRTGVPGSLRATILYVGDPMFQQVWGELLHSIQTGENGFQHLYGREAWAHREQNPELNATFNAYMTEVSTPDAAAVAAAYDFSGMNKLVDLGGGHGVLIAGILQANPTLQAIVFDQPHVVSGAQPVLQVAGVSDRCELVGGDFFTELPGGADGYILKSIIHDWDDAHSILILKNCRQAIQRDGKLLLVEYVIQPGNAPQVGKLSDINMLVAPGGKERTEAEYRTLLAEAGFRLTKVIPIKTSRSIIEAVPV